MDAWETCYADQRAAGIDRLEQLCLDKHHLKMPCIANNQNSKAKKKNVDVSQLKAPTPSSSVVATVIEDAQHALTTGKRRDIFKRSRSLKIDVDCFLGETVESRPCVKAGKISVTARPHGLKNSFAPLGSGKLVSSSRKSLSSPEPMSTGGDSERSRSPSPTAVIEEKLDNAKSTTSSTSIQDSCKLDNNDANLANNNPSSTLQESAGAPGN